MFGPGRPRAGPGRAQNERAGPSWAKTPIMWSAILVTSLYTAVPSLSSLYGFPPTTT